MELHQLSSRNGPGNKIHPLNVDQTEKQAVTKVWPFAFEVWGLQRLSLR